MPVNHQAYGVPQHHRNTPTRRGELCSPAETDNRKTNGIPQSLILTCHPERSRTFCEARNEPIKKRELASGIYKHFFVNPSMQKLLSE